MTKYYKTKEPAQEAARQIQADDDRILWAKAEFEPYNGWVVVVAAKPRDLSDLAAIGYEIDIAGRRTRDPAKARPTPLAGSALKTAGQGEVGGGQAPRGGITARVWAICDEKSGDRAAIMAACAAEGINPATAGTQYSRWKKGQK